MHYIGIDLGTSEVKAVIMDGKGAIIATESKALSISRKNPNWSEQNPSEWWEATLTCVDNLKQKNSTVFKETGAAFEMLYSRLDDSNRIFILSLINCSSPSKNMVISWFLLIDILLQPIFLPNILIFIKSNRALTLSGIGPNRSFIPLSISIKFCNDETEDNSWYIEIRVSPSEIRLLHYQWQV